MVQKPNAYFIIMLIFLIGAIIPLIAIQGSIRFVIMAICITGFGIIGYLQGKAEQKRRGGPKENKNKENHTYLHSKTVYYAEHHIDHKKKKGV